MEDFAAAFVRFDNGATLILEVSWLLHHDTEGEDMQMWLYGTKAGCHWPKCEVYQSNNATQQLYNRTLKLTKDAAGAARPGVCRVRPGRRRAARRRRFRPSSRCRS